MCTLSTDVMDSGMEFQMTSPATEKALSHSQDLHKKTMKILSSPLNV